jgi:hypothetical protein
MRQYRDIFIQLIQPDHENSISASTRLSFVLLEGNSDGRMFVTSRYFVIVVLKNRCCGVLALRQNIY